MELDAVLLGDGSEGRTQRLQALAVLRLEGVAQEELTVLLVGELPALDDVAVVGHQERRHVGDDADAIRAGHGEDVGGQFRSHRRVPSGMESGG